MIKIIYSIGLGVLFFHFNLSANKSTVLYFTTHSTYISYKTSIYKWDSYSTNFFHSFLLTLLKTNFKKSDQTGRPWTGKWFLFYVFLINFFKNLLLVVLEHMTSPLINNLSTTPLQEPHWTIWTLNILIH